MGEGEASCPLSLIKSPKIPPPEGGVLAWTQLDYLFVLGLLASLAALIGYLQRTAKRVHASTEARLASAMAERSALREFTEEGACSAPRPPCPFHQGSGQRPPTPPSTRSHLSPLLLAPAAR